MRKLPTCTFLNDNSQKNLACTDSPLQMKLIKYLGLKKYMMDNFIFKRKTSKYCIRKKNGIPTLFTDEEYDAPPGYTFQTTILQSKEHSVPILRLKPINKSNNNIIIYSHGNASDMSDSLHFVDRLCQHIETQYVIYDYSGYGQSRAQDVGEQIICKDLQIVLAHLSETNSVQNIILWGFSLGSYPVISAASKYPVKGTILQCPIASIACIFHSELHPDMKFDDDHFSNLELIDKVKGKVFITHSSGDQIIPFSHAKVLYDKFVKKNGHGEITFIEIAKIRHNSLHKYIVADAENDLQREVFDFVLALIYNEKSSKPRKQSTKFSYSDLKMSQSLSETTLEEHSQLKKLKNQIKQSEIQQILDDMDEIVIVEEDNKVTTTHRMKGSKGCFCFTDKN